MEKIEDIVQAFQQQVASNNLHHAWIIEGGREEGSSQILDVVISGLLGESAAKQMFHPNLMRMGVSEVHNIEAVRSIIRFLEKSSWDGGWKVAIIEAAETLNVQSQNALLKVFEEPSEKTILLLFSGAAHRLLSTLYSRASHYVLKQEGSGVSGGFQDAWIAAVRSVLRENDYSMLLKLQHQLDEEGVSTMEQIRLVLEGAHSMMLATDGAIIPQDKLLQRWSVLSQYCSHVQELNLDSKRILVKLTQLLLSDMDAF